MPHIQSTNFSTNQARWIVIPIFHETEEIEFMNSSKITLELTALIKKVYSTIQSKII